MNTHMPTPITMMQPFNMVSEPIHLIMHSLNRLTAAVASIEHKTNQQTYNIHQQIVSLFGEYTNRFNTIEQQLRTISEQLSNANNTYGCHCKRQNFKSGENVNIENVATLENGTNVLKRSDHGRKRQNNAPSLVRQRPTEPVSRPIIATAPATASCGNLKRFKKNPVLVGTKINDGSRKSFAAATRPSQKINLHLCRVSKGTSVDDIAQYLKTDFPDETFVIDQLPSKGDYYTSFRIQLNINLRDKLFDDKYWPEGVGFREYKEKRPASHFLSERQPQQDATEIIAKDPLTTYSTLEMTPTNAERRLRSGKRIQ